MRRRRQNLILCLLLALTLLVGVPLNDQYGALGHEIGVALAASFVFFFVKWRLVERGRDSGKDPN